MDEISNTTAVNATTFDFSAHLLTPLVLLPLILSCVLGIWTISIHGLILAVFFKNRHKQWAQKSKGTLSLVLTDFMSGLGFVVIIITQTKSDVSFIACALPCGFYLTTQLATSFHIFRICLVRLRASLRSTISQNLTLKWAFIQYVAILLVSIVIVLSNMFWIKVKPKYKFCVLDNLSDGHIHHASIAMLATIGIPCLVTTIVYASIVAILKKKSKEVEPFRNTQSGSKNINPSEGISVIETVRDNRLTATVIEDLTIMPNSLPQVSRQKGGLSFLPKESGSEDQKASSSQCRTHGVFTTKPAKQPVETQIEVLHAPKRLSTDVSQSRVVRTALKKSFGKILSRIGLIVLLNNIASLPYCANLVYHIVNAEKDPAPPYVWSACAILLQMNSALSPFVYCFKGNAIARDFKSMFKCKD